MSQNLNARNTGQFQGIAAKGMQNSGIAANQEFAEGLRQISSKNTQDFYDNGYLWKNIAFGDFGRKNDD